MPRVVNTWTCSSGVPSGGFKSTRSYHFQLLEPDLAMSQTRSCRVFPYHVTRSRKPIMLHAMDFQDMTIGRMAVGVVQDASPVGTRLPARTRSPIRIRTTGCNTPKDAASSRPFGRIDDLHLSSTCPSITTRARHAGDP